MGYVVEVFTRGCPTCDGALAYGQELAGAGELRVQDVEHDPRAYEAMERYGLQELPAFVVDGQPLPCCSEE